MTTVELLRLLNCKFDALLMSNPGSSTDLINDNIKWHARLQCVQSLISWVESKLKDTAPTYDSQTSARRPRLTSERANKAEQYVIEHLALGKILHPCEGNDPLFTVTPYDDQSLTSQLQDEGRAYAEFRGKITIFLQNIASTQTGAEVTWEIATQGLAQQTIQILEQFARSNNITDMQNNDLIGLVLRYRCMGGFTSTFHGSVPKTWGAGLLQTFVEGFASPFNHKFQKYHSMFDDDKAFGSRGNLFGAIQNEGGMLPRNQDYELNPPFANAILQRLQAVLENTLTRKSEESGTPDRFPQIILIAPRWYDASWMTGITSIALSPNLISPEYTHHSLFIRPQKQDLPFTQDMRADSTFQTNVVIWFFSSTPISADLKRALFLGNPSMVSISPTLIDELRQQATPPPR
jgi:hypothetical protein